MFEKLQDEKWHFKRVDVTWTQYDPFDLQNRRNETSIRTIALSAAHHYNAIPIRTLYAVTSLALTYPSGLIRLLGISWFSFSNNSHKYEQWRWFEK